MALLAGFAVGLFGAIPPGPVNINVIRKASQNQTREAHRVAMGAALVDTAICGFVAMGFGWALEKVVTNPWTRLGLALFLLAGGLKILIFDRKKDTAGRDDARPGLTAPPKEVSGFRFPFLVGVLQGAANPALLVNWTLLISFLVGHRILPPGLPAAAAFAVGVGLGVYAWFAILVELVERLKDHPAGEWIRHSTFGAGILLLAFGLYFTWRTVAEFVSGSWIP
ncbi:MAG: LysE family transporter [Holophagales bacterium]|nr:LysE family transporter [Holophagales bacterium]MBK9966635.1 LysE family transporter [Holophagales bacterium]